MVGAIPSEKRVSALTFLMAAVGCHVFESVQVECTSDMPCAGGDTSADTADTDTGDTGEVPVGDPQVGWLTSLAGGGKGLVRRFDPEGEVMKEWALDAELVGTPFFDPGSSSGLFVAIGGFYSLNADGTTTLMGEGPTSDAYDVTHLGPDMVASFQGGLVRVSADGAASEPIVMPGTFTEIRHVGGSQNVAFFVDPSTGGPDLWAVDTAFSYWQIAEDYDTSLTRAINVFVGPDDKPYACSDSGAVYALEELMAGSSRPVAYYDNDFDDVGDCAWDDGDDSFLLYSPSQGVFRIDADGRGERVATPSTGYDYGRVYWYGY